MVPRAKNDPKAKGESPAKKAAVPKKKTVSPKKKASPPNKKAEDHEGRRKLLERQENLREEVIREIAQVREALSASAQALLNRVDGQLASMLSRFEGQGLPDEAPALPSARAQAQMLLEARALKVKPHKGRAKDLTRIEDLVSRLAPLAAPKG